MLASFPCDLNLSSMPVDVHPTGEPTKKVRHSSQKGPCRPPRAGFLPWRAWAPARARAVARLGSAGGVLLAALPGLGACRQTAPAPELHLEVCVRPDGTATPTWTDGIAVAIGRERAEALARERLPLSSEAAAWLDVLRTALPLVESRAVELASFFDLEPFDATVAAGNRGSSDGFGWVPTFVGINVQAFHDAYGAPDGGAVDRMTRIVAHEYLHLLTYAFYPDHRERRDTPLNRALWTMFFEGIGDYVSVSARWLPDADGAESPTARATLQRLEPILVERLEAFVDASEEEERALRRGIAMGKFDEKWGSLPVALWLHAEAVTRGERALLEETIRLGPASVLPLALRHAAPELRPRLEALAAVVAARD